MNSATGLLLSYIPLTRPSERSFCLDFQDEVRGRVSSSTLSASCSSIPNRAGAGHAVVASHRNVSVAEELLRIQTRSIGEVNFLCRIQVDPNTRSRGPR